MALSWLIARQDAPDAAPKDAGRYGRPPRAAFAAGVLTEALWRRGVPKPTLH